MSFVVRVILIISIMLCVSSCNKDEVWDIEEKPTTQTVIMFFPWSTNLLPHIKKNIQDMSETIEKIGLKDERVIVCLSSSPYDAELLELKYTNGKCFTDTLMHYTEKSFTSSIDIADMLNDVKSISPAEKYGLIIGCHGMGWLPVVQTKMNNIHNKFHYEMENVPMTRYFGGLSSEFQIETKSLAEGILYSGMEMEYILFDDCYMSSIEVAYDLRNVTDYLIACPTEILAYGFPYHKCGEFLIGEVDYSALINAFLDFYENYHYPYGTAAVTNCKYLEDLAEMVKEINMIKKEYVRNNIQIMDGYEPALFYDFKDYIYNICTNSHLFNEFSVLFDKTVPYKCCTEKYFSALKGTMPINDFSGITTSEPSSNSLANSIHMTEWYNATH